MSQSEILEYLKLVRIKNPKEYLSPSEVKRQMKRQGLLNGNGKNIPQQLLRLYNYGYLDIKVTNRIKGKPWYGHKKAYRIKEKKQ